MDGELGLFEKLKPAYKRTKKHNFQMGSQQTLYFSLIYFNPKPPHNLWEMNSLKFVYLVLKMSIHQINTSKKTCGFTLKPRCSLTW